MIRLIIADDHALVRAGFRQLVGEAPNLKLVGEAASGEELLARLRTAVADVVVLDVSMPGPGVSELLTRIGREHPNARVLVVSVHPEGQVALRALQAGAAGYVNKAQSAEELVAAVKKVHAGGRYVSPKLAEYLAGAFAQSRHPGSDDELSDREGQVLRLLGAGRSNKEIAALCRLSPKTVSTYRARILRKLRLRTNADLVRYALENQLTA